MRNLEKWNVSNSQPSVIKRKLGPHWTTSSPSGRYTFEKVYIYSFSLVL